MYLDALFENEEYIYIIEGISQKLLCVDKKSKNIEILMQLPWKSDLEKNGILQVGDLLYIYSLKSEYFVRYHIEGDKRGEILKFEHLECDGADRCYSNFLIYNDHIILLPFMGTDIKIYDHSGGLQENIPLADIEIWKKDVIDRKIRAFSAVTAGDSLYFSVRCEKENDLCRYDLKQRQMSVVYHSDEIPIRGVYRFEENIVFRRLFPQKTEFVFLTLDGKVENRVTVDKASSFGADIYIENGTLVTFVYNKLITIDRKGCLVKKQLKWYQTYIEKGALFDEKEGVLSVIKSGGKKYEFTMIANEIRKTKSYIEGKQNLLTGRNVLREGANGAGSVYRLLNEYLYEVGDLYEKKKRDITGKTIWEGLSRKEGL